MGGEATVQASFGEGDPESQILLDDVACVGSEDNILNCPRGGDIGSHNCGHNEDAGVICIPPPPPGTGMCHK